jgi:polyisoprenoid-binding protein YceI
MNRTHWLAVTALLWTAQVHAQAAPAAAPPAKPTPAVAPSKPAVAAPAAPAKPTVAAPTTPTAPAAATAAATPAKPATTPASVANDKNVEWSIDPGHSHIGFVAKHLGFTKVNGQFKKFSGKVFADPKTGKIANFEAEADTASVDTGIEKRDTHLKSDDFFNAEKYPQLKLKLKSIKWNGNKFTAKADLTIRDVTKEVPFKGELLGVHMVNFGQGPQQRAGYEATATISRKDFGLKYAAITEGLSVVGDAVDLNLDTEIVYVPPAVTAAAPTTAPATPAKTAAAPTTAPAAPAAPGKMAAAPAAPAKAPPTAAPSTAPAKTATTMSAATSAPK